MTDVVGFFYTPGKSLLHNLDIRFKLISLMLLSLSSIKANFSSLCILLLFIMLTVFYTQLSFKIILKQCFSFSFLLALVFLSKAMFTPDEAMFSKQGLYLGSLSSFRLIIIILLGILFISTTKTSEIKHGIEWFFKPVPFISEAKVAIMISLVIRFLPYIINLAKEISDAQKARCIENRKNPVYRIVKLIIPLLKRIFQKADDLTLAMEARSYSEHRTEFEFISTLKDWISFIIVLLLCMVIYVL